MHSYALKFIMLGDSRVGKSQLARCFTNKSFNLDSQSTVGMEFSTKTLEFEKCVIRAQLWDTAGQERFESMTRAYFRDAVGAAVVFDITDRQSFLNVKTRWLKQLKEYGHESMKIILIGNKVDLTQDEGGGLLREVSIEEAINFAKSENIDYIETSALTGYSVQTMYRRLVLSVAKLIPDVKNNLELTALPDGWMLSLPPDVNETPEVRPRAASDDAATTMETSTTVASYVTSKMTPSSLDSKLSKIDRRKSTTLRLAYVNYWTGESQREPPAVPASAGLLYTATLFKKKPIESEVAATPNQSVIQDAGNPVVEEGSSTPKLLSRDSSRQESVEALTERSSSAKTIELSDPSKRKARKCSNCIIL